MNNAKTLILNAAAAFLGLASGAMLLIATSLIPYWASLSPAQYRATFGDMDLGSTMLLLGGSSLIVTIAALLVLIREPGARRNWVLVAAVVWTIPAITYPVLYEPVNLQIAGTAPLTANEVFQLLHRWQALHWFRTVCGLIAFAAMIAAINSDASEVTPERNEEAAAPADHSRKIAGFFMR